VAFFTLGKENRGEQRLRDEPSERGPRGFNTKMRRATWVGIMKKNSEPTKFQGIKYWKNKYAVS